jgi:hypothetical protein
MEMPPTPELDKMSAVRDRSQTIGDFLDWLSQEKNWHLGAYVIERDFEPGERFTVEKIERAGSPDVYRVRDHGSMNTYSYVGGRWDTREEAEESARLHDEDYIRRTEEHASRPYRRQSYAMEELLAEFFEIDLKKVEEERRAILEAIRS